MDHESTAHAGIKARLRALLSRGRDDRGSVLAFATFALFVIMGMVALSVDLGMLYNAETEAQRAADSGALAGAAEWVNSGYDEPSAKNEAITFAEEHVIQGGQVSVTQSDVTVDQANDRVTVVVSHDVDMIFAGLFGFGTVTVNVDATAQAFSAAGASCPLPLAVVDRWDDSDGNGAYDAGEPYISCPGANCTSYQDPGDRGQVLEIKQSPGGGGGGGQGKGGGGGQGKGGGDNGGGGNSSVISTCEQVSAPGWECWYRNDHPSGGGGGGSQALRQRIDGCVDPPDPTLIGENIWAASGAGNKQSLLQNLKQYIDNNDPTAFWDDGGGADGHGCVKIPGQSGCVDGTARLRTVPLVDPTSVSGGGANVQATTSSLAKVFLEKVASDYSQPHGGGPPGQWNLYVRFAGGAGGDAIAGGSANPGSQLKTIILVE